MRNLTKKILKENDSYINALQQAIEMWKNANDFEEKKLSIVSIGEIGKEIYKQNKLLNI